jgi:UDP-glucose 4-epimerase
MAKCGVNKLIFSSSAAVYGVPERVPIPEEVPLQPINPYGRTKAVVEQVLQDLSAAKEVECVSLRYFNVAGADRDGRIGEGKEDATHLITLYTRAAAGMRPYLSVFGTDYPTPDGTCIRDYIHVVVISHFFQDDFALTSPPPQDADFHIGTAFHHTGDTRIFLGSQAFLEGIFC